MTETEFWAWERASHDTIDFKKCYVDVAGGDVLAGLLLSQVVYWFLPSKETGKTKLRVRKQKKLWLMKQRGDWWRECRLSPKQFDRAAKVLEEMGIIETAIFRFKGKPSKHIALNFDVLLHKVASVLVFPQRSKTKFPDGEKRNSPNVKNLKETETTTQTTTTSGGERKPEELSIWAGLGRILERFAGTTYEPHKTTAQKEAVRLGLKPDGPDGLSDVIDVALHTQIRTTADKLLKHLLGQAAKGELRRPTADFLFTREREELERHEAAKKALRTRPPTDTPMSAQEREALKRAVGL